MLGHPIIVASTRAVRVAIVVNKGHVGEGAVIIKMKGHVGDHAVDGQIHADVFGQRRVVCRRRGVTRLDEEWDGYEILWAVQLGHERGAL